MSESKEQEPKLQPPGAGLPWPQLLLLRTVAGPLISKLVPASKCRAEYERITEQLIERISQIPLELRRQRILVPPQVGLEDSSRYWSINGVMEHILIVSQGIERVILALSSGKIPDGRADTATVKPQHMEEDSFPEFSRLAPGLFKNLDDTLSKPGYDLGSPLKFKHPWIGRITARQWYWVLSQHQAIHYRQTQEIAKRL